MSALRMERSVSRVSLGSTEIESQIAAKREGRRKVVFHGGTLCSHCLDNPPRPGQRYCGPCHASDERARRAARAAELKALRAQQVEGDMADG